METINENQFFKVCSYRHCNNSLDGKRTQAKFCCRACKSMEGTYILNKKHQLEKYILKEKAMIELIKMDRELSKGT